VDEAALREKVGQLMSEVERTPQTGPVQARSAWAGASGSAMRREMASLEEGLDHIRLAVKYLLFDLEATKRENRLLRGLLGEG